MTVIDIDSVFCVACVRNKQTWDMFQQSRSTGSSWWAIITLQTVWWEIGGRSRSWNNFGGCCRCSCS